MWINLSVVSLPKNAVFVVIIVAFSFPMTCSQSIDTAQKAGKWPAKPPFYPADILIFILFFFTFYKSWTFLKNPTPEAGEFTLKDSFWT